jgi:pimeloyl-ACP methyl ester carboxylesterase
MVLVPDHDGWPEDLSIEAIGEGTIELERTDATARPGLFGIGWQGGHATVGPLVGEEEDTVRRRLLDVDGYLPIGGEVAIDEVYVGDPLRSRGLPFKDLAIDGELGPMPAWLVPPRRGGPLSGAGTWAIFVHGINGSPESGLVIAPLLRRLGVPGLYLTYRDDLGAPESPDGYHHLGLTEWRDVEAAAREALSRGARRLVLVGYSMGGALVTQFMQNSALASQVSALVLDAPVLDWTAVLEFNATEMGLPGLLSLPVRWAIGARIDVDWDSLDAIDHAEDLQVPILLFHGTEDDVVPIETSEELAEELPEQVTFHRVPRAGHVEAWNVDPPLYEKRVASLLEEHRNFRKAPSRGGATGPQTKRARPKSGSK